jgi:F-type H+-transporting ATPase subunit alpha
VGGNAQVKAMRSVAGRLRIDLAQYRELEAFAAFGSDLDKASQQQLARGARLVELLKQPAASPFSAEREVVSIWAGTTGQLDDLEVADVRPFEAALHDHIAHNRPEVFASIVDTGRLEDDVIEQLEKAVVEVKAQFTSTVTKKADDDDQPKPRRVNNVEAAVQEDVK